MSVAVKRLRKVVIENMAAIKLGTPEPEFLQSGRKLTCSQKAKPLFGT